MTRGKYLRLNMLWAVGALLLCPLVGGQVLADCSEDEMTAVFIVSGIYPGTNLEIHLLTVEPVGEAIYPSEAEMIASVQAIQPGSYTGIASAGPFHLFFEEPGDFGGTAIVDGRDGAIAFAGTVIWLGCGVINVPDGSTHGWTFPGGDAALGPGDVEILPNEYWGDIFGSPDSVTTMTLDYLRQSDVLKSFGACDTYDVVSYIYTPAVGATDPTLAGCVIIVSGHCGPPWNGDEVPIRPTSWNKVKARYK